MRTRPNVREYIRRNYRWDIVIASTRAVHDAAPGGAGGETALGAPTERGGRHPFELPGIAFSYFPYGRFVAIGHPPPAENGNQLTLAKPGRFIGALLETIRCKQIHNAYEHYEESALRVTVLGFGARGIRSASS
jgi:hypothetical protein